MTSPGKWTEDDLKRLVLDGTGESLRLEFKSCGALTKDPKGKEEVGKDISAMANSAGGTIIYGIIEKEHVSHAVDTGFSQAVFSKEWLEQVIDSNVQPRIEGLVITVVPLSSGFVAYVADVPQATNRAPHQAADRRYYKRANFSNQTMEDYEIRDILRRAHTPDLYLELEPVSERVEFAASSPVTAQFSLVATIGNSSTEPAYYAVIAVYVDEALSVRKSHEFRGGAVKEIDGGKMTSYLRVMGPSSDFPVIQEQDQAIGTISFAINPFPEQQKFCIVTDIRAPGCIKKQVWQLVYKDGKVSISPSP